MGKRLVLVGGGHAHMVTLARLHEFVEKGIEVTVIGPSSYHYYSGMGPGMLGGTYSPDDIRFATRMVVEKKGGRFIEDRVTALDPGGRRLQLASGDTVEYDVVSFNAGSHVPTPPGTPASASNIFTVKPIERLMEAGRQVEERLSRGPVRAAVVGGGPSSAEIAGNLWQLARKRGAHPIEIQIFAGSGFMKNTPDSVRRRIHQALSNRGVKIHEPGYIASVSCDGVVERNGHRHPADVIFLSLGVNPSSMFKEAGLACGPDGGLLVNTYLQCPEYPEIFGGGDCIHFAPCPLDKVGVYAVRQNPILCENLMAAFMEHPLKAFEPGGNYLLIFNIGGGKGVLHKNGIVFSGRVAFIIKDIIDRRFMRKFQALEKM
jgi:NADH dehydrogenase FAD-containing subunit